ncbi:SRPBCC family protein [Streptosporangium sp. NPDC049304]|uniref:type II toxin-antitoxin system RatA family toxin n=1 Tax=Streptosporangium sp. NPDC049304 TaxID=3154830 RepID=UPI003424337D
MPQISATAFVPAPAAELHQIVREGTGLPALAPHVLEVEPQSDGTARWSVLLNGSRVGWTQREATVSGQRLVFAQTQGDFDSLVVTWTFAPDCAGTRVGLSIAFHLGIDGLAPLLDPIWAQSLRAHANLLLSALASAKEPHDHD